MIAIENVEVHGFKAAIRGMRNSHNSWDKSDSPGYDIITETYHIGDADLKLMKSLVMLGPDHSKFMRMITVTCDITGPLYWWKEFDTYKVGTVRNSCSTMHKIHSKDFVLDDFSHEHLDEVSMDFLDSIIQRLNHCRTSFVEQTSEKRWWWQLIQLLPSSYNQKSTVQLNYGVLRNIYHSRRNHKLDEWKRFCEWVESLPYSELITMSNREPINQGRWIISSDGYYSYCSKCGCEPRNKEMTKFCAECGAIMNKE